MKRTGYIAKKNWAGKTKARKSKTMPKVNWKVENGIENRKNCKGKPENGKSENEKS